MGSIYRTHGFLGRARCLRYGVIAVCVRYGFLLLVCGMGAGLVRGQSAAPNVSVVDGKNSTLLDPEYRDDAHGLRICPPAGVQLVQKGTDELVSFVQPKREWVGSVKFVFLETKDKKPLAMNLEDYLKSNADALNRTFTGVSIETSKIVKFGEKQAGRQDTMFNLEQIGVSGKKETLPYYKQDLMMQMATNQFVHLTMFSPLKDKDLARATFEEMLKTFSIVDIKQFTVQRKKSMVDGQLWLDKIVPDQLAAKLEHSPRTMKIMLGKTEMGFVTFTEGEDVQGGMKGASVSVKSYSFQDDGSLLTSATKAWWAYTMKDGQPNPDAVDRSGWEALIRSIPATGPVSASAKAPVWTWQKETGSTIFDMTIHGQLPGQENEVHPAMVMKVETVEGNDKGMALSRPAGDGPGAWIIDEHVPMPLPKVLEFMWPRVVDLSKPMSMSFPVFNSGTRKLGLRTIAVGEETLTIDGKAVKAIHLTDELDTGSTAMWVDKDGKVLLMKTSDGATLIPTTQEEMDRRYGSMLKRAGE